jgi:rhamnosyltransferase
MKRVLVMMSTYNGAKFVKEQIESILHQNNVDVQLLIRDDGSNDQTVDIVRVYLTVYHNIELVVGTNIGCKKSFYQLLEIACEKYTDCDYYAFADQDDVWLLDKLYVGVVQLAASQSVYKLYFCNVQAVDCALSPLAGSETPIQNNLIANIIASQVQGCTMIFNYQVAEMAARLCSQVNALPMSLLPYHDGWIALLCHALGATVIYDETPHMYYRIHGQNVVGVNCGNVHRIISRIKRHISGNCSKSNRCKLVYTLYQDKLPEKSLVVLQRFAFYRESIVRKLALLFSKETYPYNWSTNLGTFFMILLNKF